MGQTDERTSNRYIRFTARCDQHNSHWVQPDRQLRCASLAMNLPDMARQVCAKCEHRLTDCALVTISRRIFGRILCKFWCGLWLSSCVACNVVSTSSETLPPPSLRPRPPPPPPPRPPVV